MINIEMLDKAMTHIKILANIRKLITSLFGKRQLRVITLIGLSDLITTGDRIDQNEAISSLLWRIFYDPLLRQIQENSNLGFTATTEWTPDMTSTATEKLSAWVAVPAYMDDITWVARSWEDLKNILKIIKNFYTANDSCINTSKLQLLVFNTSEK